MSDTDETSRGDLSALAFIWAFFRPYRLMLVAAILALLFTAAIALALPFVLRLIVDGFSAPDPGVNHRYFLLTFVVIALLACGSAARNYLTKLLAEHVVLDIRKAIFARVLYRSPAFFERTMTGDVLSRITADTTVIALVIGTTLSLAMRHSVMFSGGLIMLLVTSPKLTALVVVIVPLVMGPILLIGARVRTNMTAYQTRIAASSAQASEALLATQTIQAHAAETQVSSTFQDLTEQALDSARAVVRSHSVMNGIVILCVFLGMVGVAWFGTYEVQADAISLGELVQFAFYSIIVATSLAAFSDVWGETQRVAGAATRLAALLDAEDVLRDPEQPKSLPAPPRGEVIFEDVRFSYPTRPEVAALEDVSFQISPGETVALVGPSGAGKSTVLQLLLRFYDPDDGCIRVDGIDLKDLRRQELRQHIAVVQQDPMIFATSLRDNIRFGRPDATDTEVEAAAKAAAAHGFISELAEGYNTFVGERGVMLSGGQKQRITIARAILRDAPILLLDEATSALDTESEQAIQTALDRLTQKRTTLVIAHRLSTVERADRILVFDGGQIVAEGTHQALLAEDGLYARYARAQLSGDVVN